MDPAAGFVIAAFALKEGREAWEGGLAGDDDHGLRDAPAYRGAVMVAGVL
jgi:hypothetical protein